jgi:hypothetical protein
VGLAERHAALRATRGLLGGFRIDEVGVDLVEVAERSSAARFSGVLRVTVVNFSMRSAMRLPSSPDGRKIASRRPQYGLFRGKKNVVVKFIDLYIRVGVWSLRSTRNMIGIK